MRTIGLGLLLLSGVGCLHLEPIGPLAGGKAPRAAKRPAVSDGHSMPVLPPAPPPIPPASLVTPGDVSETNAQEVIRRFEAELDADRKTMEKTPRYSEVSVVRGER